MILKCLFAGVLHLGSHSAIQPYCHFLKLTSHEANLATAGVIDHWHKAAPADNKKRTICTLVYCWLICTWHHRHLLCHSKTADRLGAKDWIHRHDSFAKTSGTCLTFRPSYRCQTTKASIYTCSSQSGNSWALAVPLYYLFVYISLRRPLHRLYIQLPKVLTHRYMLTHLMMKSFSGIFWMPDMQLSHCCKQSTKINLNFLSHLLVVTGGIFKCLLLQVRNVSVSLLFSFSF